MSFLSSTEYPGNGVSYNNFGESNVVCGGNIEDMNEASVSSLPTDMDRQKLRERNRRYNRHRHRERYDRRRDKGDGSYNCDEGFFDSCGLEESFRDGFLGKEEYNEMERNYNSRRNIGYNSFSDRGDRDDRRGRNRGHRDRARDRIRDRDYEKERDRERSRERDRDRDYSRERDWREEIPNNTIMVRGLAPHITEGDLRNEVTCYGLEPKDVRLMRKKYKDTGASRGFAFVEFHLLSEAIRWKELTQGVLIFGGDYRATLHYSIPKDGSGLKRGDAGKADWSCSKCGLNNFRRRDACFKCDTRREESDDVRRQSGDGCEQISSTPSNALLFRNLDVLTTEEKVLSVLGELTSLPIKSLGIVKDPLTNTSRGFCLVELHSISEATQLHDMLLSMNGQFYIDNRQVNVTYARKSVNAVHSAASANAASVALAAAQWTNRAEPGLASSGQGDPYQQGYEKYQVDYSSYYQSHYGVYSADSEAVASGDVQAQVTQQVKLGDTKQNTVQGTATISKGPQGATGTKSQVNLGSVVVDGVTYAKYPVPDTSSYQYDETSGYYYDPVTALYYDPNSQYYYNAESQQFVYWDGEKQTYLPAPTQTSNTHETLGGTETESTKDDKSRYKQDKVRIAKKIAKDMERWAKTLNQKKENAKQNLSAQQYKDIAEQLRQSAAADAGFSVLEKRSTHTDRKSLINECMKKDAEEKSILQMTLTGINKPTLKPSLVAAYDDCSDSDTELDTMTDGQLVQDPLKAWEIRLTDMQKMACLLCKRQFPNKDALSRHQQLSDLHKQNLETLKRTKLSPEELEIVEKAEREAGYRDRAKERREKYGQPENPHPNKLKDKYLKNIQQIVPYEQPTKQGIGSDNIGNKMMKAMGWSEGQGLGRANQGISNIIEVERRVAGAGLGMAGASSGTSVTDSYKDTVKKSMQARYNNLCG
ncbi:RNA-binding protein 5-like isoform X2 [Tachypleus tridentatus]|uniref:RNA-binding protein 5-like isoform X2 n=1 Tax=Tachypleus tridentatus TaxID=6853 RepID=UPI003FD0B52C